MKQIEKTSKARSKGLFLFLLIAGINQFTPVAGNDSSTQIAYESRFLLSRYLNHDEHKCTIGESISTDLHAETGSFGNMFDIGTDSSSVLIESIDFYTDRTIDMKFHVWTKSGSHRGYEKCEECWTKVAEGSTRGRGKYASTPIPRELFTPVYVDANEIQSFVVVLETPDIRYNLGISVEEVDTVNDHLSIYTGTGVSQFPAFHSRGTYLSPRLWKGAIHYSADVECTESSSSKLTSMPTSTFSPKPSQISSSIPSTVPTSIPKVIVSPIRIPSPDASYDPTIVKTYTDVIYSFTLEHEPMAIHFLSSEINDIVTDFLTNLIKKGGSSTPRIEVDDTHLLELINKGNLKLDNIVTDTFESGLDSQCQNNSIENFCSEIQITSTFVHVADDEIITPAQVKYALHLYVPDMVNQLRSMNYDIKYTGPQTVSTDKSLAIDGVDIHAFTDQSSSSYFEKIVLDFLTGTLNNQATIADVKIKEYKLIAHDNHSRGLRRNLEEILEEIDEILEGKSYSSESSEINRERLHLTSSVNVTLSVTGEYQPPPHVDLSEIVSDSFENEGGVLVESLRGGENEQFQRITAIEVQQVEVQEEEEEDYDIAEVLNEMSREEKSFDVWTRPISMLFYCAIVLLISAAVLVARRKEILCFRSNVEKSFVIDDTRELFNPNQKMTSEYFEIENVE